MKGLRRFKRGSALVTVLMVVAIAAVLSTAMLGSAFFNLNVSVKSDATNIARNLADSAIANAAEQALETPNIVLTGVITSTPLVSSTGTTVDLPTPASDYGFVSFVQSTATPWSVDNLEGGTSVQGWESSRTVPPNTMDLVGVGTYHGTKVVTEAIIYLPPYPYVMAGTGTVKVNGNLLVAGTASSANVDNILANPVAAEAANLLLPADVGNNATSAPTTMFLTPTPGASVLVTGNVQTAASQVQVTNGQVAIHGQIVRNGDQITIPQINIASYDTSVQPGVGSLAFSTAAAPLGDTTVTGYAYNNGDVYVAGDLKLNGGVLYIQGALNVTGSVTGKGAIFTTGNATINGNANLTSDDSMALVSGGDINLTGQPSNMGTPSFQGLLYTQGNLTATNIAIVGNYVANGGNTSVGNINLQNVSVVAAQDQTTVHITPTATATTPPTFANFDTTVTVPQSWMYNTTTHAEVGGGPAVTFNVTAHSTTGTGPTSYDIQLVPPALPPGFKLVTDAGVYGNVAGTGPTVAGVNGIATTGGATPPLQGQFNLALSGMNYSFAQASPMALGFYNSINAAVTSHTWVQTGGGTGGGIPANSPSMDFSFNQFLTPIQEARVLMWNSAVNVGTIEASSTTIP